MSMRDPQLANLPAKVSVVESQIANSAFMRRLDVRSFTSSGNYTIPSDAKLIYIEMWSGGAGGNGGESDFDSTGGNGQGGGAGFFNKGIFPVYNAGSSVSVVVGAGGVGGGQSGNTGADGFSWALGGSGGGHSSFGTYLTVFAPNGGYQNGTYYPYTGWEHNFYIDVNSMLYNRQFAATRGGNGGIGYWNNTYATNGVTAGKVFSYGTSPISTFYTLNSPFPNSTAIASGAPGGAVDASSPIYYTQGGSGTAGLPGATTTVDGVNWYTRSGGGGGGGAGASTYWHVVNGGTPIQGAAIAGWGGNGGFPAGGGGGGGGAASTSLQIPFAGRGGNGGNGLVQIMVFG